MPACRPSCLPACWPVGLLTYQPAGLPACLPPRCNITEVRACLPTGLPSCRPAFRPAYRPGCQPAFLPTSLPACLPAWLSSRCHVFSPLLILPAGPSLFTFLRLIYLFFFADMPSYRWPRPCLLSSLGPSCLPACRTTSFYFSKTHLSFFLCRHAVIPMAAAMPSLISWTFLPACLPDRLFQH